MKRIIHNRARCKKCGDVIESKSRHDFVMCSCNSIFVDGGHEYLKRGGKPSDFEELSETEDVPDKPGVDTYSWIPADK